MAWLSRNQNNLLTIHHAPDHFELDIVTKIFPQKNTALSGLYRSQKTFCTQCEAEGFRRITYFPDRPDVLARYTTTITADLSYPYLLSNGNLISTGKLENNRHFAKWEDPFNKPSYLFALVAGDFDLIEDKFITQSGREVELRIYVEKGYGEEAYHAMYALKEAMRWDEKTYGREYDLDIYMIVAIGDFNMGAMENKGLNIFNTQYILAKPATATDNDYINIMSVVAHEYFHNWTGNRVTCRDWFQLSLKEGLTIFRDQSFSEDMLSAPVMRIREVNYLREVQFAEDAGPLAHPVRPDSYMEINNFYTTTIYNKGSEVLRMLRTILGENLFRKGMDLYFAQYDGHAVTIEDYIKTMEDVSGKDFTQFRLWYSQAGTPEITVQGEYNEKQKTYKLIIKQFCPSTPGQKEKEAMHIPIRMGLLDQAGNELLLQLADETPAQEKILHLTKETETFEFKNITTQPIPSLLRHFSAPVKLYYDYSDADLLFLFKHDKDAFNRWEAGQQYALRTILHLVQDQQQGKTLSLSASFTTIYKTILEQDKNDPLFLDELLKLPSEKYIAEQMAVVDIDAIHIAREFVLDAIAKELKPLFLSTYQECHAPTTKQFNLADSAKRSLKNRCLAYLMRLPDQIDLANRQFNDALTSNMTDTLAALQTLSETDSVARKAALEKFYTTWQHDALVMDKWLAIQASSKLPNTLEQVESLLQHPAFDIKNPNKVYALIGTFGHRNSLHFHAKNGTGYQFLRKIVQQLDELNPQVAARMVKPLTSWKRYDKEHQSLMRTQLELLLKNKKISPDLYELVSKSLT